MSDLFNGWPEDGEPEYIVCPYCGERSDDAGRIVHSSPCRDALEREEITIILTSGTLFAWRYKGDDE